MSIFDSLTQSLIGQNLSTTVTETKSAITAAEIWALLVLLLLGIIAYEATRK